MASKSKRKGDTEERSIINLHREWGFECKRTLEAGARSDGSDTYDIDLHSRGVDEAPMIGECKLRASGFKQIYKWLGDNDFLTIRADRQERLYVVPERIWKELLTKQRR
jgi:hypothetical protein